MNEPAVLDFVCVYICMHQHISQPRQFFHATGSIITVTIASSQPFTTRAIIVMFIFLLSPSHQRWRHHRHPHPLRDDAHYQHDRRQYDAHIFGYSIHLSFLIINVIMQSPRTWARTRQWASISPHSSTTCAGRACRNGLAGWRCISWISAILTFGCWYSVMSVA